MSKLSEYLIESSLSRIYRHNEKHDCGTITAFRNEFTYNENLKRNKSLAYKLLKLRYSITKISGRYIEETEDGKSKPVTEESFFVVDIEDKKNLKENLHKLGNEFEQDSVLFIPHNTIKGEDKAYFIFNNGSEKYFNGTGKFGYSDSPFLSYVNGRPFYMDKMEEHFVPAQTNNGRYLITEFSNRDWRSLKDDGFCPLYSMTLRVDLDTLNKYM